MKKAVFVSAIFLLTLNACHVFHRPEADGRTGATKLVNKVLYEQEKKHFKSVKQLTFSSN